MNCKPGDLAVIVRSRAGNHGKFVTVLQYVGPYTYFGGERASDTWLVRCEQKVVGIFGVVTEAGQTRHISDNDLRPIRDPGEDAQDESRAWLPPVPSTHKEPA